MDNAYLPPLELRFRAWQADVAIAELTCELERADAFVAEQFTSMEFARRFAWQSEEWR